MNWLKTLFGTSRKARPARRPMTARLEVGALEDRRLMSVVTNPISAITTHPSSGVTNHDLYAIDANTHTVVDYHNGTQNNQIKLYAPSGVTSVSAGIDPQGNPEVFALAGPSYGNQSLWRYDGSWQQLSTMRFAEISATRDGQVYATLDTMSYPNSDVELFNANGGRTDLGTPPGGYAASITASRDVYGQNTVFVIDGAGNIWNYDPIMGPYYGWRPVDTRFNGNNYDGFVRLSAPQGFEGAVYAVTSKGELFEEITQFAPDYYGRMDVWWVGRQLASGRVFQTNISADIGADGYAEVYAIESGTTTAYRYGGPSSTESVVDYNVSEISGADGGYFFDVNPSGSGNTVWAYDPNSTYWWDHWQHVGDNVL
jgi:hypothetical protein